MRAEHVKTGYEQVFTVMDYYDRPAKGLRIFLQVEWTELRMESPSAEGVL